MLLSGRENSVSRPLFLANWSVAEVRASRSLLVTIRLSVCGQGVRGRRGKLAGDQKIKVHAPVPGRPSQMLHTEGAHPGLSDEDHSTFRLHIVLVTARIFLRRLQYQR